MFAIWVKYKLGRYEMSGERYEFSLVTRLEPDAVGVPGQRRFRLLIEGDLGTASLWLEKEQLQALGLAIDQILEPLTTLWSLKPEAEATLPAVTFTETPTVDLTVGRLALGYDEAKSLFLLLIFDAESEPDIDDAAESEALDPETERKAILSARASREQLRELSTRITALVSAGRPRCPICGQPMEEGIKHTCPGSNGHIHG